MLYVFHVDAGQMTTYDMSLTLQSVTELKVAIERRTKIPISSLVLLVSGGEVLQADHRVSSYSAGTDTNPIYMFSKPSVKDSHLKQSMCGDLSPVVEVSTGEFRNDSKSIAELKASVEMCCSLPATINTVIKCANIAQQFSDLSHEVSRSCDQLVHEQHLQHQGWAAVVANLEDIYNEFCERSRNFKEAFRKHRLKKEEYHEKLNTLNEVLESLGKIPILPALQVNAEAHRFSAFDVFEEGDYERQQCASSQPSDNSENKGPQDFGVEAFKLSEEEDVFQQDASSSNVAAGSSDQEPPLEESEEGITFKANSSYENKEPTLLHWILAQGNKASLQDIVDYCQKGLQLIDNEPLKKHEAELCHILEYANMHGLKQIKGIENRLYLLDQLLIEVKKLEKDQHDQAQSLIQYRDRLNSACDPSVLPTLVQSHWCQLEKLLKGHHTMIDIRRRIVKSKDELSHILKARLEAILVIENSMSVQDAHAMLSFQCYGRLERYFEIVGQLHRAPAVFLRAVTECARRAAFSARHHQWATDLAEKLLKIHNEEVERRREFNAIFDEHFLRSLFPGMTDLPPAFATQAPAAYDTRIPQLSEENALFVAAEFPELAQEVPKYDMTHPIKFFEQRLNAMNSDQKTADDKVEESETETLDFEKLPGQLPIKEMADISTSCAPDTMAVSTVTEVRTLPVIPETPEDPEFTNSDFYIEESLPSSLEWGRDGRQDNMDTHKIDMNRLQDFFVKLCGLCKVTVGLIREELNNLKFEMEEQKNDMHAKYLSILDALEKSNEETELRFREQTQRLTVDHELELSDMKSALDAKDQIIEGLKKEMEDLKAEHQKEMVLWQQEHQSTKDLLEETREEIHAFNKKLEELEVQKQKEIKDLQDKLHLEYKAEIESLRSRFRLVAVTNMDRSPSESSLEKIERTDVIEINTHNSIVMQTKENAEVEKEEAVREAVKKIESDWQHKYDNELAALKAKYINDRQTTINDVTRRLLSEKEKQLEAAREREQVLARECTKYRDTIQQLTDPETNDYDALLKTQLTNLEGEKAALSLQVQELKKELEKRADEDKSREEDSDNRSSSPRRDECRRRVRCHTPLGLAAGALSLSSCLPGHTVLLLWDPAHLNYTVLQEAPIMYFVHSDCLPALDLSIQMKNESHRRLYAVATVESKEYCYAKKSGNRYLMARGSRFYRVRVRPLRPPPPPPACCDHKHKDVALPNPLASFGENRPVKKWLTYMHAPDMSKSVDTSQSTSSATDESRIAEVATATLINLDSPVSASDQASASAPPSEDQLDSIESGDQWHSAKNLTPVPAEMECSVGQCSGPEPLELAGSAVSVVSRGPVPPGSEVAEEATP